MKSTSYRLLQALLWVICLSHLSIGAGIMLSSDFQQFMARLYGAQVDFTPQFTYILRPLGAYMITVGILGVAAAFDPLRYRVLVYAFSILLGIRVLQRVVFQQHAQEIFHIDPAWYFAAGGVFLVMAIALVVLLQLASRPATTTAAAPAVGSRM